MKGQVDAPIELVVAVIILLLSMGLALHVIGQTDCARSLSELKTSTQHLQEAMQDIALGSAGTKKTVQFAMPTVCGKKVDLVWFVYYDDPGLCHACPTNYGGCWQIVPATKEENGYVRLEDAVTCVNMPGRRIELAPKGGSACERLSSNPCPIGDGGSTGSNSGTGSCRSNVPDSVWTGNAESSVSRWQTLGRRVSVYDIVLEKSVSTGGGEERGVIQVCAQQARR